MNKKVSPKARAILREAAKYGMSDRDMARLVNLPEKDLLNMYFSEIYEGQIEGKLEVQKICYEMATSGECPSVTMFWLRCRDKWSEQHQPAIQSYLNNQIAEEEEFDFNQLNKEELEVYERLRTKAKKKRVNVNTGSESAEISKNIH